MILPLLGFFVGSVFYSVVGLILLSHKEMISVRNLLVFVAAGLGCSVLVAAILKLVLGWVQTEPLRSLATVLTLLMIIAGGCAGGFFGVSFVERHGSKTA